MSISNSSFHRRADSSFFVNDAGNTNLTQLSPRNEERGPYTMICNQESSTNFIGDSILNTQLPKEFAVTKTGEKHILDLEIATPSKTNSSNPYTMPSPRFSEQTLEKISEKSISDYSMASEEQMSKISEKSNKKTKPPKCYVHKKPRLVFTPRNMENNSSEDLQGHNSLQKERENERPIPPVTKNKSAQTEVDTFLSWPYSSYQATPFNNTITSQNSKLSFPRYIYNEPLMPDLNVYRSPVDLRKYENLKIYTKTNPNLRKYSELRAFASALTLITMISWLFSTIFDVDCLWDYCSSIWQYFQNIFFAQEKPKTTIEAFLEFVTNFLSYTLR